MSRGKLIALVVGFGLLVGAVLGGVTAALVLRDGGSDEAGGDGGSGGGGAAGEAPDAALQGFYDQDIDWSDCEDDDAYECGWLEVPLDYQEPDGETIELRLRREPAAEPDERIASLVTNPGGPGASGADFVTYAPFSSALKDRFDIVGFDPRGTGESSPIDCLSDEELDEYMAYSADPETPEGQAGTIEWQERFGAGCEELSGDLVNHVSTVETARDMDVLRAALGDEDLHYVGFSYGTTLGAVYATYFPERSQRLVLDGATDPSLDRVDGSISQIAGFEVAWDNFAADCQSLPGCPLGSTPDEASQIIDGFFDELLAQPIATSDPDRPLTAALAQTGVQAALYSEDYWPILTQAIDDGLSGDGTYLLLLADSYADRAEDGTYNSNLMEAFYAISCLDDPTSLGPDEAEQYADDFAEASPTFGQGGEIGLGWCSGYTGRQAEEPREVTGEGAAPIVVIGTTGDPATPYEEAVAMADELESGVLLTREGEGHTAYGSGNSCIDDTVDAFLLEGEVPEDGTTC
ncbi:alpha/beta hydrolase [Nocardioides zeae]|uniref:Alpha/beta hydrolase n=1 Tax=Nocardioides imazamoxiresistens TaxID=3231893 RepID=A0ABU3Q2W4_9ACTN|nr:alpha/beta hydrolase [Nocardioides zeae]MDT9595392.1 alpha/beta hydrolase [Nocardioides zeae]